ncbi:DNA polymerase III subunit delta' [Lusitaniella coriacea]|uniref:DNA polymerase III subunit delta' n=1 Tax=Lusitaniella coriacea TaxID=1983105 RepID=UPI003CE74650
MSSAIHPHSAPDAGTLRAFHCVVGHRLPLQLLTAAISRRTLPPAYLFVGTPGIGKSIVARCFSSAVLIPNSEHLATDRSPRQSPELKNHPDLLWVEPTYRNRGILIPVSKVRREGESFPSSPQIRLEQVKAISQFLARSPLQSPRFIVVIEGAERMNAVAANALLKTLEEPGNATLILLAPTVESLLPTIVSRCQLLRFHPLRAGELQAVLERAGHGDIGVEIRAAARGSAGRAIALHELTRSLPDGLLPELLQPPSRPSRALEVAKTASLLAFETQLQLADYLCDLVWQQALDAERVRIWARARDILSRKVQPRLVWEVALIQLLSNSTTLAPSPAPALQQLAPKLVIGNW